MFSKVEKQQSDHTLKMEFLMGFAGKTSDKRSYHSHQNI